MNFVQYILFQIFVKRKKDEFFLKIVVAKTILSQQGIVG